MAGNFCWVLIFVIFVLTWQSRGSGGLCSLSESIFVWLKMITPWLKVVHPFADGDGITTRGLLLVSMFRDRQHSGDCLIASTAA